MVTVICRVFLSICAVAALIGMFNISETDMSITAGTVFIYAIYRVLDSIVVSISEYGRHRETMNK